MAKRTNSPYFPGQAEKGSRPAGSSARLPTGAKVSVQTSGGANTFTGRVPGAMKGLVGGAGNFVVNARPFKSKAGSKGVRRNLRG